MTSDRLALPFGGSFSSHLWIEIGAHVQCACTVAKVRAGASNDVASRFPVPQVTFFVRMAISLLLKVLTQLGALAPDQIVYTLRCLGARPHLCFLW